MPPYLPIRNLRNSPVRRPIDTSPITPISESQFVATSGESAMEQSYNHSAKSRSAFAKWFNCVTHYIHSIQGCFWLLSRVYITQRSTHIAWLRIGAASMIPHWEFPSHTYNKSALQLKGRVIGHKYLGMYLEMYSTCYRFRETLCSQRKTE